jgi:protein phosphatase 2C family protein 2/3
MLDKSGSCAIVALLVENKIYIVNVGDSRAILSADGGNYCVNLSLDHKPNDDIEQKRILQNGGRVYQTQTIARGDTFKQVQTITYQPGQDNTAVLQQAEQNDNPNIIYGPFRVFPGRLSVSRTFGDIEAKREKFAGNPNVVIAIPDIKEFTIDDKMDFLLLGCDGIFDKISNAEVIKQSFIAAKKNFHQKDQPIH